MRVLCHSIAGIVGEPERRQCPVYLRNRGGCELGTIWKTGGSLKTDLSTWDMLQLYNQVNGLSWRVESQVPYLDDGKP